jgi:hypothetical protein
VTEVQTFSPSVKIDGITIVPEGWMWVLSFAFAGCQWAIDQADTAEFKARIRQWMETRRQADIEQEIAALEARLAHLKAQLQPTVRRE